MTETDFNNLMDGPGPAAQDESRPDSWDPKTGYLTLTLPIPVRDNELTAASGYGKYPTTKYRAWLEIAAPLLREALGDWAPDTDRWWEVRGMLWLPDRSDAQNRLKAALDLLGGAHVVAQPFTDLKGRKVQKGSIIHNGGLWDNDSRVIIAWWGASWVRHETPCLTLEIHPTQFPPRDWKEMQAAEATSAKGRVAAEKARERLYFASWTWAQCSKKPRAWSGTATFEGQPFTAQVTEDGPLMWIGEGPFGDVVISGELAYAKKNVASRCWEAAGLEP